MLEEMTLTVVMGGGGGGLEGIPGEAQPSLISGGRKSQLAATALLLKTWDSWGKGVEGSWTA